MKYFVIISKRKQRAILSTIIFLLYRPETILFKSKRKESNSECIDQFDNNEILLVFE